MSIQQIGNKMSLGHHDGDNEDQAWLETHLQAYLALSGVDRKTVEYWAMRSYLENQSINFRGFPGAVRRSGLAPVSEEIKDIQALLGEHPGILASAISHAKRAVVEAKRSASRKDPA